MLSFSITVAHCPLRPTKFGTLQGIPPKYLKASVTAAPNKQGTKKNKHIKYKQTCMNHQQSCNLFRNLCMHIINTLL